MVKSYAKIGGTRAMYLVIVALLLAPAFTWAQTDGFVSLMPKANLSEFWSAAPRDRKSVV